MNLEDYINSKSVNYKQCLLHDLKKNMKLANIVNSVFFPLENNIEKWLEETEVKSFYEYDYKGDFFFNRICNRDEINLIPYVNLSQDSFNRYTIFSCIEFDNYEEAINAMRPYYIIKKDFYKVIDKIIFNNLNDYKRETNRLNLYSKRISNKISITLSTDREYIEMLGIIFSFVGVSKK